MYLTHSVYTVVLQSQFPHKSVNLSFLITHVKNDLTDLCGNRLLQNACINTLCEVRVGAYPPARSSLRLIYVYVVTTLAVYVYVVTTLAVYVYVVPESEFPSPLLPALPTGTEEPLAPPRLTNLPGQWLQRQVNGSNVCRVLRQHRGVPPRSQQLEAERPVYSGYIRIYDPSTLAIYVYTTRLLWLYTYIRINFNLLWLNTYIQGWGRTPPLAAT